jgi:hypothetical protein
MPTQEQHREITSSVPTQEQHREVTSSVPTQEQHQEVTSSVPTQEQHREITSSVRCQHKNLHLMWNAFRLRTTRAPYVHSLTHTQTHTCTTHTWNTLARKNTLAKHTRKKTRKNTLARKNTPLAVSVTHLEVGHQPHPHQSWKAGYRGPVGD